MELIEKLRTAAPDAYEAVYRAYAPLVLDMLQRGVGYKTGDAGSTVRLSSASEAEDVCHEAFCEFFRQCERKRFDTSRPPKPYILRIAARLALKRVVHREVPTDQIELGEVEPDIDRSEQGKLLSEFLTTLAPEDREVVAEYFDADKRSQRAIAERLGLSRDQVYRKVVKIRKAAKTFFSERGWFDES